MARRSAAKPAVEQANLCVAHAVADTGSYHELLRQAQEMHRRVTTVLFVVRRLIIDQNANRSRLPVLKMIVPDMFVLARESKGPRE